MLLVIALGQIPVTCPANEPLAFFALLSVFNSEIVLIICNS